MRQGVYIQGNTPQEFIDNYNEECANLSRFEIVSERFISDTEMYIFYVIGDGLAELPEPAVKVVPVPDTGPCRKCAECGKFLGWRECLDGHKGVRPTTEACSRFDPDVEKYERMYEQ